MLGNSNMASSTGQDGKANSSSDVDLLLHPELLSEEFLKLILKERKVKTRDTVGRDELTELYLHHVMPLPQRTLPSSRWGRTVAKTRGAHSESNRKRPLIVFDGSSSNSGPPKMRRPERSGLSSGGSERLKPPPGAHMSSPPGAHTSSPPGAHMSSPPGARMSSPPGARMSSPPGARMSSPPGARMSSPPGARMSSPPGARMSSPPGARMSSPPGARMSSPPGAHTSSPPGAHTSSPPGAHTSSPPGAHTSSPVRTLAPLTSSTEKMHVTRDVYDANSDSPMMKKKIQPVTWP
ncbi:ashwin isoform X2 [Eucyclogobius newberryi]|uniref:ashwin isoform X2 n=1 Tax=Eucyclogobius newberryi TaxID=166745 RepID=UPI003B58C9B0